MFFEQARAQAQTEYEQDGTNAAVGWLKLPGERLSTSTALLSCRTTPDASVPTTVMCISGVDKVGWSSA